MKLYKTIFFLSFISAAFMPGISQAIGDYVPGTVTVTNDNLGMTGSFNVRHNPNVSLGRIYIYITPGQSISLTANDSSNGRTFNCHVRPSFGKAKYKRLERALSAVGNGSVITAVRGTTRVENVFPCNGITIENSSRNMD